jgi:hypothetical protein
MKRTNLVLDEQLLEDATRELRKVQALSGFFGTKIWSGNLSKMREEALVQFER